MSMPQWLRYGVVALLLVYLTPHSFSQAGYTAQIRGVVTDSSNAIIPNAKVTITNSGTNISMTATTDATGAYVFSGIRPSTYTLKAEASGFHPAVQDQVVLAVSQQASINLMLQPAGVTSVVEVRDTPPLLDASSASLGTDVTNEFISRMPLADRNVTALVYLSAGVTENNDGGLGYPVGTDFSSNGQRYGSAEIRLDGALATGPESGEGATTNLSYVPSGEVIQEFKVQNNSFSAEYGSNGGTVVNVILKSGANKFHGSGWWFGRRTALNANDYFSNANGIPRTDSTRDQYGFSISGPIIKQKTFFLFDLENVRQNDKLLTSARVPTDLERSGDFSQTLVPDHNGQFVPVQLFNPFVVDASNNRAPLGSVIPAGLIDPVGKNLVNAYPEPTGPVNLATGINFNKALVDRFPVKQFDAKIDHQLSTATHLMGRYSQYNHNFVVPGLFFDGNKDNQTSRNIVLEHTWAVNTRLFITNRFGLDRYFQLITPDVRVNPTQFGLPYLLIRANNLVKMPVVVVDDYSGLNVTGGSEQCCLDTIAGHTQYVFSSSASWVVGKQVLKFGGEQRIFFNNFYQPDNATGRFAFSKGTTAQNVFGGNPLEQGIGLASLLMGFGSDGGLNIKHSVANKSKETSFFVQDDWKVNSHLTVNLGLRYEWSTPYNERHNQIEFSDFKGSSGVTVDLTPPTTDADGNILPADLSGLGLGSTVLKGITRFTDSSHRNVPIDRNNWAPRLGFAYQLQTDTVVRGGAGIFYGVSVATNYQYAGTAFRKDAPFRFSLDGGVTRHATFTNLFPELPVGQLPAIQGKQYGPLANWGYGNQNDLGTTADRNAEIYQWNLGVQHLFPFGVVLSTDYSANHSTHLSWGNATRNRNFMSDAILESLVTQLNPAHDPGNTAVSDLLNTFVANPFQSLFVGPNSIFNEPFSQYSNPSILLGNLLRPYPQFDTFFSGLPLLEASSWYHGLLIRFQKRQSHGLSFEGNYTLAKSTDYSSYGANDFIFFNGSGLGGPQDLNNLKAEHSVGASDTRHRFVLATIYDLPVGRGRWLGRDMNRALNGMVGGWAVNILLTIQSGQPIPFAMANQRLTDGFQRPNTCATPMSGLSVHDVVSSADPTASYFNLSCFTDPGDQITGNAPRFSSNARGPGIKNIDVGVAKEFPVREGMKMEVRAEFFNVTNTPRFGVPSSFFGDPSFGKVTSQRNSPRNTQVAVRFEF